MGPASAHAETHSVAVFIDKWEEVPRKEGGTLTRIMATVHVERPGHKGIIIGRGGEMMKKIGTAARMAMEEILDRKIFLEVFVKVSEEWRDKEIANRIRILKITLWASVIVGAFSLVYAYVREHFVKPQTAPPAAQVDRR